MEFLDKVIKTLQGDKGGSKEFWVDDIRCKVCFCCEVPFNVFVRKHHCRICGRIFCGNCTKNAIPPPRESTDQNWLRVCDYCKWLTLPLIKAVERCGMAAGCKVDHAPLTCRLPCPTEG